MKASPLFTDLYQLTMMCAYLDNGKRETASFELFVRELPRGRNYLVYAGLEDVVELVENIHFTAEDIDYLHSLNLFPDWFLDFLKEFEFSGDIYSMKEGTLFFPHQPVLRVDAPIYQAQLLETAIVNQIHISSLIATKAARVFSVSRGKLLADFSLRRTHGYDAGLKVARSCYIAGFCATSNVLAGKLYSIPVVGTVAHSFIMSFESEKDSFTAYAKTFPEHTTLLVDTYDTVSGVKKAIEVASELKQLGFQLKGVRLDSGDIVSLAKLTRRLLDQAGLNNVKIIVSGGLDEFSIDRILRAGAPVDAFGVGTKVGTSSDSPFIDFVYKLVEFNGKPVMKTSTGKEMFPGRKQVFRAQGHDTVGVWNEALEGKPILHKVVEKGKRKGQLPSLKEIRDYFLEEFSKFPAQLKDIHSSYTYPVHISDKLLKLKESLMNKLR